MRIMNGLIVILLCVSAACNADSTAVGVTLSYIGSRCDLSIAVPKNTAVTSTLDKMELSNSTLNIYTKSSKDFYAGKKTEGFNSVYYSSSCNVKLQAKDFNKKIIFCSLSASTDHERNIGGHPKISDFIQNNCRVSLDKEGFLFSGHAMVMGLKDIDHAEGGGDCNFMCLMN